MAIQDLAGFGIRGFRSFGSSELQFIGPMSAVHMVVGKNNVGKSNVLRIAQQVLPELKKGQAPLLFQLPRDTPDGWELDGVRTVRLGLHLTPEVRDAFRIPPGDQGDGSNPTAFELLASTEAFSLGEPQVIWLDYDIELPSTLGQSATVRLSASQFDQGFQQAANGRLSGLLRDLSASMTQQSSDDFQNYAGVLRLINPWKFVPDVSWVEAKRTMGNSRFSRQEDINGIENYRHGRGLIAQLAALERPEVENLADKKKWAKLERFVQSVLEDDDAHVTVSSSQSDLMVETRGRNDSYMNLGTGIGEVVHLAAAVSVVSGNLICIEEPELHLHPTLQRKMLQYFADDDQNRYLLATHSAAFLDSELASISHVTFNVDTGSHITPVRARQTHAMAVSDLGNRSSDLVQSNFLIWVEGPSDRLYVNHWLHKLEPGLLEGSHYSIMFYGGALLSHLMIEDEEVQDLIDLAQINRNLAIVIDSDKGTADAEVNETKARVLAELEKLDALGWVTEGYTIENYVPHDVLTSVVKNLYPKQQYQIKDDLFVSPLSSTFVGSETYRPSKVAVARAVSVLNADRDVWSPELQKRVAELASRIKHANGLD